MLARQFSANPVACPVSADQSPSPVMVLPTFTGPRWPPPRRSTREKIPSPWRVLGSRNGVDRGHRRPGDSPPRNRLETPQRVSPAGIPLRHAGCLHSVSSHVLRAHAHQVVSFPDIRHTPLWCLTEKAADSRTRHSCLPRFTLLGVRWRAYWTLVQPHAPAVRPRPWECLLRGASYRGGGREQRGRPDERCL